MALRVLTPPAALPLSLAEVKSHLRVDLSDEDALITAYLRAAIAAIDGPEGWLGRCLINQTLELTADEFPYRCDAIRLPCPQLLGVTSISYVDQDGAMQTVPSAIYQVVGIGDAGRVELAYNQTWPSARRQSEAVRIVYTAGYGPDWNSVPESIRAALLLMVGDLYGYRENMVEAGGFNSGAVGRLLLPFKVYHP